MIHKGGYFDGRLSIYLRIMHICSLNSMVQLVSEVVVLYYENMKFYMCFSSTKTFVILDRGSEVLVYGLLLQECRLLFGVAGVLFFP